MPDSATQLLEIKQLEQEYLSTLDALDKQIIEVGQQDPIQASKIKEKGLGILQDYQSLLADGDSARKDLEQSLATGAFITEGIDEGGRVLDVSPKGITERYQYGLSAYLGAPVDLTTGINPLTRFGMAFKTADNKLEYLRNKFGENNVKTMDLNGGQVTLVRDPKDPDGKFIATDEFGFSVKDVLDISGEIFPAMGSIAGGALALGSYKNPFAVSTGSAEGYMIAGIIQDAVATAVTGSGPTLLESIPQRGAEAAMGMAIEYPMLKAGGAIVSVSRRMRKGEPSPLQVMREADEEYLSGQGIDIAFSELARGGDKKLIRRLKTAQEMPRSKMGRDITTGLKRLEALKGQLVEGADKSKFLYDQTVKDLQHEADLLVNLIGAYDKKAAMALRAEADDVVSSYMLRPKQDVEEVGNFAFSMMREAEVAANKIKDEVYSSFYKQPEVAAIQFDPIKVAKAIEELHYSGVERNPALEAATQALRKRPKNAKRIEKINKLLQTNISPAVREKLKRERSSLVELAGPITAQQMDGYVRLLRKAYPESGIVGVTPEKRIAGRASKEVQAMRDQAYENAGLLDEWNYATSVYQQRLGFEEGAIGNILREKLGRSSMTPTEIANTVVKDPRISRDLIAAASLVSPQEGARMAGILQNHYFQTIGITGNKPLGYVGKLDFDEGIVKTLFSVRPDGTSSRLLGEKMVEKLNMLKVKIDAQKLDPSKITESEIAQLQNTLSEKQFQSLAESITQRLATQKKLDELKQNVIFDIASKGHVEAVDRPAFAEALLNPSTPISKISKTLAKFSPDVQKSIRGDFLETLMAKYAKSGETGFGAYDLWDAKRLLEDIQSTPSLKTRMEAVIGKPTVDKLLAASRQLEIIRPAAPDNSPFQGGAAIGSGGKVRTWLSLVTFRDPIRRRWVAGAYRANQLSPFLDRISKKELSNEEYLNAFDTASKFLLTTGNGVTALTQTGKYDPEYAAELGNLIGTVEPEGLQYERKESQKGNILNPP